MPCDMILIDQLDEVCRFVSGECGFCKMRVFTEIVFVARARVGKVAPTATGDQDFLARGVCMIEQENLSPTLSCGCSTH